MVPVPKEQATVVMVVDTSGSMAATDVQPNRLVAAQQAAPVLPRALPPKFRVALVSFNSITQTLPRPTTDRQAAAKRWTSCAPTAGRPWATGSSGPWT